MLVSASMPPVAELKKHHSLPKLRDLGRQLRRSGRHEEAIEVFSALAESGTVECKRDALAARAATYEKLGQPSKALADGKQIIDLDPVDVRGYLITGHLLTLMRNLSLAEKIYHRGLRFCQEQSACQKLQARLVQLPGHTVESKVSDPLFRLPSELLEMVFVSISLQALCRSLKVSKPWRTRLTAMSALWIDVDLSSARGPVRRKDLINSAPNSQPIVQGKVFANLHALEELELSNLTLTNADGVFATCLRTLRVLKLTNVIGTEAALPWLEQYRQPSQPFPFLRELLITPCSSFAKMMAYSALVPRSLRGSKTLQSLTLDVGLFGDDELRSILHGDQVLGISDLRLINGVKFRDCHAEMLALDNGCLNELALQTSPVTGVGIRTLAEKCPSLKRLRLTDCFNIGLDAIDGVRRKGIKVGFHLNADS
ncbi:MAG: hypothetical protein Q9159_006543 [Coniocarpon cinnabarinum]